MRLLRLATLIAVGASVAVEAATASTVNADIRSIKSHLNTLTKSLTSFTGQSSTATQILEDSDTLRSAINKAAKDSKALSALNIDDTVSIANAVTALQINIYSSLKLLISKEPQFKKASSKNVATVKQKLQLLVRRLPSLTIFTPKTFALSCPLPATELCTAKLDGHLQRRTHSEILDRHQESRSAAGRRH